RDAAAAAAAAAVASAASADAVAVEPRTRTTSAEQRAARKDLARLERQLDRVTQRQASLQHALLDAGGDVHRLVALDAELRAVLAEKDELELEWLSAAEAAESS
ncbi:MAG TPA: ABC transporter ATP-binding protein, partial [Pseudonocardiaceae bacterium]